MGTLWRIECFGGLRASCGGGSVTRFRTRKAAHLLAALALAPKAGLTRDSLCERLWPDEDPAVVRNRLKQTLSLLRHDLAPLGDPPLAAEGKERLRLVEDVAVDAAELAAALRQARRGGPVHERLAALARAASLYGGPLLPEFYDDDILAERARLEEAFVAAETERVALLLDQGDVAEAREAAHRAARLAPESERARALMEGVRDVRSSRPRSGKRRPSVPAAVTPLFGRERERAATISLLAERRTRLRDPARPRRDREDAALAGGRAGLRRRLRRRGVVRPRSPPKPRPKGSVRPSSTPCASPARRRVRRTLSRSTEPSRGSPNCPAPCSSSTIWSSSAKGAAPIVRSLLERVGGLSILVTSRQTLGLRGEARVEIPALAEDDAVKWFLHQAQAARADFALTPENEESVRAVCRRLDGLPLALELAAAWTPALTPGEIVLRLERPMELLVRPGGPGSDPRHAALAETIAASFRLLPEGVADLWLALSVFRDGWWRDAAEAVTGRADAAGALALLRERSLVSAAETSEGMRWSLLAPLREFAADALPPGAEADLRRRHADHYLRWAHQVASELYHVDAARSFALLEGDEANIQAALREALAGEGERLGFALTVFRGLGWHWWVRGKTHLGAALTPALDALESRLQGEELSGNLRASVLRAAAATAWRRGDLPLAEARYREARALHDLEGDPHGATAAGERLADLWTESGRHAEAVALLEEGLRGAEETGRADGGGLLARKARRDVPRGGRGREARSLRGAAAVSGPDRGAAGLGRQDRHRAGAAALPPGGV